MSLKLATLCPCLSAYRLSKSSFTPTRIGVRALIVKLHAQSVHYAHKLTSKRHALEKQLSCSRSLDLEQGAACHPSDPHNFFGLEFLYSIFLGLELLYSVRVWNSYIPYLYGTRWKSMILLPF